MAEKIKGSLRPEPFAGGRYSLQAPGLRASVAVIKKDQAPTRSGSAKPDVSQEQLIGALENNDLVLMNQFEITIEADEHAGKKEATTRAGGLKTRTSLGEPAMLLRSPRTRENMAAVVLYTDESGEQRWIFPHEKTDQEFAFALPREKAKVAPEPGEEGKTRGKITKGIRKIVQVVAWLFDKQLGAAAVKLAQRFEEKKRPYGFLALGENGFTDQVPWSAIDGKRSLLLLHGTFSTAPDAFDGLAKSDRLDEFLRGYEGRVFAFNHPSLHKTPAENISYFLEHLPNEIRALDVDIVTHSRGGLVGRALCAQQGKLAGERSLRVNRAIFVAGPHAGTPLADPKHMVQLVDTYTNLLTKLPDNVVTIVLEAVVSLVKIIGGAVTGHLPGLVSMLPQGAFLSDLDQADLGATEVYVMGARYSPQDPRLLVRLGQQALMLAMSKIFGEDSDLVVPTSGVWTTAANTGPFPIVENRREVYEFDANIHHLNFFQQEAVNQQLLDWLRPQSA
jgi:pimeloyl-ACP methyl ester carboxylesterase